MKVFAIVVAYNGLKWLDKCITSLLESKTALKIIIIDNGSTDGTKEYVETNFPTIELLNQKENVGFGRANNLGIGIAFKEKADYFFLLNQDAWIETDTICSLIDTHQSHPEYGIISPMHLNGVGTDFDINFCNYIAPSTCPGLLVDVFLHKVRKEPYSTEFVNAAAWLISRRCIEHVGGFNPAFFLYGEDDNYVQRAVYHDFKVGISPLAKIFHDRAQRSSEHYYFKKEFLERKALAIFYNNPNHQVNIKVDIMRKKSESTKALLSLNFKRFKKLIQEVKLLQDIQIDLEESVDVVRKKGLSFLNVTAY